MDTGVKPFIIYIFLLLLCPSVSFAQELSNVLISGTSGLSTDRILLSDSSSVIMARSRPLFSFRMNGRHFSSEKTGIVQEGDNWLMIFENILKVEFHLNDSVKKGWGASITFENRSEDTLSVSNVVPFGEDVNSVYITGEGPPDLARARLFRPGMKPLRVILPDNSWELGYSSFYAGYELSVCALARRRDNSGGIIGRYETKLPPLARVTYSMDADVFRGEWQNGLRIIFRDRYLYDLDKFDNTLFGREDLAWIKSSYLIILQMAWDREFYDRFTGKYTYPDALKKSIDLFGKVDVFGLWPTWPRLGLDQRNQWDLYRDLPGGIQQLRTFVNMSRMTGTRFFISYNPWDLSTRMEDHLRSMARLISETDADGIILDTMSSSGDKFQETADSVKKGVIMYPEGMAVPRNMPGIISGRVHNAIFLSPELNLNKLIKPDFSIFRVCDVGEDILHRELAVAFFNGYGTELNLFKPGGRDDNYRNDLAFLSRTTFILRQNNDAFLDADWTPLQETVHDSIYVNRWRSGDKSVYTVLNMRPEGVAGKLFWIDSVAGKHFVSLWNHEIVLPKTEDGKIYLTAKADGFPATFTGTRREGTVDCIAAFPELMKPHLKGDSLKIHYPGYGKLLIWKGNPSYQTTNREFTISADTIFKIKDLFGFYEGKIVLQLTSNGLLLDEDVITVKGGAPWLISRLDRTEKATFLLSDMVLVPSAKFSFSVTPSDEFVPYPAPSRDSVRVDSFLIDRYPVTNAQYYDFVTNSGYIPSDTTRYLRHWQEGTFRQGQDKYPVVYVSYEDMMAYARWAGKRLPSEKEWQLAAQGTDKRIWPWGNEFHGTQCNNGFERPTPVDAFSKGQSPYGVMDLVGNVWQMTGDLYFNGSNYFAIIRGGSYYKPESSWWYIRGGPQQLDRTQALLMVSPGFDRSSTVGFRCVKDVDIRNFRIKP